MRINQELVYTSKDYHELDQYFEQMRNHRVLLVCGKSYCKLPISSYLDTLRDTYQITFVQFSDFAPNPQYPSIELGVERYKQQACDMILAIGGGSAIDVAKCIKLFCTMDSSRCYLEQEILTNDVMLWAIPTTAGTGSESTRFAVIYYKGEKQSVSDPSCIPSLVFMDAQSLRSLPIYHRKASMLDALCHAIESYWSVNSTEESMQYARMALQLVMANSTSYLCNTDEGNLNMLKASNYAGKAINITQTTAGHAMCYKLTTLYGLAHGHAAALCVSVLWPYMLNHPDKCIDKRGTNHLVRIFHEIATALGCTDSMEASRTFDKLLMDLALERPHVREENEYSILTNSVNTQRLKNHPIELDSITIDRLYHQILE